PDGPPGVLEALADRVHAQLHGTGCLFARPGFRLVHRSAPFPGPTDKPRRLGHGPCAQPIRAAIGVCMSLHLSNANFPHSPIKGKKKNAREPRSARRASSASGSGAHAAWDRSRSLSPSLTFPMERLLSSAGIPAAGGSAATGCTRKRRGLIPCP